MAPFLFSTDRDAFLALSAAAERGDESALQALREMWGTDKGDIISCFLCSAEVGNRPIIGIIFPTLHDPETLVGAALCLDCAALDNDAKWEQAFARLREREGDVTIH